MIKWVYILRCFQRFYSLFKKCSRDSTKIYNTFPSSLEQIKILVNKSIHWKFQHNFDNCIKRSLHNYYFQVTTRTYHKLEKLIIWADRHVYDYNGSNSMYQLLRGQKSLVSVTLPLDIEHKIIYSTSWKY